MEPLAKLLRQNSSIRIGESLQRIWLLLQHSRMRKPIAILVISTFTISAILSSSSEAASKVTNPIPITLPVKPVGAITFANIEQKISEVPAAGYKAQYVRPIRAF